MGRRIKTPAANGRLDPAELLAAAVPADSRPIGRVAAAARAVAAEEERRGIHTAFDDPHRLARIVRDAEFKEDGAATLIRRGGEFLLWDGGRWADAGDDLAVRIQRTVREALERENRERRRRLARAAKKEGAAARRSPSVRKLDRALVDNVRSALGALEGVAVSGGLADPSWLGGEGPWPADEVLAFPNSLVHLPGLADGLDGAVLPPSPRFFSTRVMPLAFDPDAAEPTEWLRFLGEALDEESVGLLQEWVGYCLVPDTRQQKILLVVGPPRSGKSTIGRVLARLVGPENAAAPSLSALAGQFGCQALVGRLVAVVGDARLSGRADQTAILERLLSISGEDRVQVDRKFREPWTGTLSARLTLLTNEVPQFQDAAMALASRLLAVRMTRSFAGEEDFGAARRAAGRPALGRRGAEAALRQGRIRPAEIRQVDPGGGPGAEQHMR